LNQNNAVMPVVYASDRLARVSITGSWMDRMLLWRVGKGDIRPKGVLLSSS